MSRYFYILITLPLVACITEYEPDNIEHISHIMVVDGIITDGTSEVQLSRSVALGDDIGDRVIIPNADVYVESSGGDRYHGKLMGEGMYYIDNGELNFDHKYRLYFTLEGREYASQYVAPLRTPQVKDVNLYKQMRGEPVQLRVSTEDEQGEVKYYRWRLIERWEVHAELFANSYEYISEAGHTGIMEYDINSPNNIYHCWGYHKSFLASIASADNIQGNAIVDHTVKQMPATDDRFSYLYYVEITQNAISPGEYEYVENLRKNLELTGDIFSPIPSEARGNITCLTDPDEPVIGYISASTHQVIEHYFDELDDIYEVTPQECRSFISDYRLENYVLYLYDANFTGSRKFAPAQCVDCRLRPQASKRRPEGWPSPNF